MELRELFESAFDAGYCCAVREYEAMGEVMFGGGPDPQRFEEWFNSIEVPEAANV